MEVQQVLCVVCGKNVGCPLGCSSCPISDMQKGSNGSILLENYVNCLGQHFQESNFEGNENMICDSCSSNLSSVIKDVETIEGVKKEVSELEKTLRDKLQELKTTGQRVALGLEQIGELMMIDDLNLLQQHEIYVLNVTEQALEGIRDEWENLEEKRTFLKKWTNQNIIEGGNCDVIQFRSNEGTQILSNEEEENLAKTIKTLRQQGNAVSSTDIKRICFEYCDSNGIPNQFDQDTRMASEDWYCGFLKRHPDVKISRPRNGCGEALMSGSGSTSAAKVTFSASEDVTALADGTIDINTAPTEVSRPSDNPNPKQPAPINLKSCLKKSKKRASGTGEVTQQGSDSKRAKKGFESSISILEEVKSDEDAEMKRELAMLEIEDDEQVAEESNEEENEAEERELIMEKAELEVQDVTNGEGGINNISDEAEEDFVSGEEKDGIEGEEGSDNDDDESLSESCSPDFSDIAINSAQAIAITSDDHGTAASVLPEGSGDCPGSAEDNDESRKEAVEKARKWYEDYMGNRKLRRKKQEHRAANPNPVSYECPVCLRMFQYESTLVYHIPVCADLKLFKCRTPHCDKTFRNVFQARIHYQRCHLKLTV